MTNELWSWILTAGGATTAWMACSGHRHAWIVGLACQMLWLSYGLITDQSGFLASVAIFSAIYLNKGLCKKNSRDSTRRHGILRHHIPRLALRLVLLAPPRHLVPARPRARAEQKSADAGTRIVVLAIIPDPRALHTGPGMTQRVSPTPLSLAGEFSSSAPWPQEQGAAPDRPTSRRSRTPNALPARPRGR